MITPEEIAAALKLCEAAPWETCNFCMGSGKHLCPDVTEIVVVTCANKECLVTAARTLLPRALAEIKQLRQAIEENKDGLAIKRQISYELENNAFRAENERLRNEPPDVAETREALAEGEVLLENIKLRAENEKLRMDAALKTGYVEAVVGYDELRRIIRNLRAENAKLLRVKEAAETLITFDKCVRGSAE